MSKRYDWVIRKYQCLDNSTVCIICLKNKTVFEYVENKRDDFQLRMAKNPEKVKSFYESLVPKLQPIWEKEKAEILKLKEEEVSSS